MHYAELQYEETERVVRITLNRPEKRNPLGSILVSELCHALERARDDSSIRVIILTGAGQVFSAGGDLAQLRTGEMSDFDGQTEPPPRTSLDLLMAFTRLGKPIIAMVNGHAMGGGHNCIIRGGMVVSLHILRYFTRSGGNPMRTCKLALVVLALVMVSPWAVAQEEAKPDFAAAKTAFKAGQEFMQMHRYADAVVEFTKAYEITKDGLVMGQVAEAFAKGSDFEAALTSIKIYHAALPEGERAPADQLIAEYEKAIKEGRSQKLALPTDKPVEEEIASEAVTPPTEEEAAPKKRLWTWVAAGTTGALFVGALVMGLNAQSAFDDATSDCKPYCDESTISSIESKATTADVLWGLTAVAAVTTGLVYWLEGRSMRGAEDDNPYGFDEEEEEDEDDEEEEDMVQRLRFQPVVGAGTFGLSAGLKF